MHAALSCRCFHGHVGGAVRAWWLPFTFTFGPLLLLLLLGLMPILLFLLLRYTPFALLVQFRVFSYELRFASFVVAATASTIEEMILAVEIRPG